MSFDDTYDACVLHPAGLRDPLVRLAMTRLYRAHWSDVVGPLGDPAYPVLLTFRGVSGHSYSTGHFVASCLCLWLFVSTGPHPAAWLKPAYIPAKQPGREGKPLWGNQPGMQELLKVMPHGEQRRRAARASSVRAAARIRVTGPRAKLPPDEPGFAPGPTTLNKVPRFCAP